MEIGIQRTDSQRSQNNNGPRVSFNKDVHVKRIGSRQPEIANYQSRINYNQSPLRVELSYDLSKERFLKEAGFVLAQANTVEKNRKKTQNIKNEKPDKFNSLPVRKKKAKQVKRSISDASSKKLKRPTLFNIFSRKSDSNLDQIDKPKSSVKKIGRSKSDVGTAKEFKEKLRKRNNSENEDQITSKKKTQLSPIIEVIQRDDYFSDPNEIINSIHNKKGNVNNIINKTSISVEENNNLKTKLKNIVNQEEHGKKFSSDNKKNGKISLTNQENNSDLIIPKKIAEEIKETITTLTSYPKLAEDMHSSQQPTLKPTLTKGLTVDGMVKRLSMERFSPPPQISGPAFSYTRPNEQIIYAQESPHSKGSSSLINLKGFPSQDRVDFASKTNLPSQHENFNQSHIGNNNMTNPIYAHRNNSDDDDEGLGFELKKDVNIIPVRGIKYSTNYNNTIEDELKSEDVLITPKLRDVPPEKHFAANCDMTHRGRADGMDTFYPEFQDLSQRRKILESRIKSRKIGGSREIIDNSPERDLYQNPIITTDNKRGHSVDKVTQIKRETINNFERISPEQDIIYTPQNKELVDDKYHKFGTRELHTRYSPQRNHIDMISLVRGSGTLPTSKSHHETKCYNNGRDGFKEAYISETKIGRNGKPYVKERLSSPKDKEIDLGYIEDHSDFKYEHVEPDTTYFQQKYRFENEPKNLDSQFNQLNRSSPEHIKYITTSTIHGPNNYKYATEDSNKSNEIFDQYLKQNREDYTSSLKRQKKHQRSFDKCDSGIENDYRKDSFNGELNSRWCKRTIVTDIKSCEQFLKKEQKHTEETFVVTKKYNQFIYRERSIDDGSHFDPRLDKYSSEQFKNGHKHGLKREKKISGLEKVKQLFSGTNKKKSNNKLDEKLEKDKSMVQEDEMRARYKEYRGQYSDQHESKIFDISTRRRLSTPKASPIPMRNLPLKSISGQQENFSQKSGWFKSIDRLSRKKPVTKVESTEDHINFKSETLQIHATPPKNLRFFGDTDIESKTRSLGKQPKSIRTEHLSSTLPHPQKKLSKSAYDLNKTSQEKNHLNAQRHKSASLQHLEENHQELRVKNLQNISESFSASENDQIEIQENEEQNNFNKSNKNISSYYNNNKYNSSMEDDMESEIPFQQKRYLFEEKNRKFVESKTGTILNESPNNLSVKKIKSENRSTSYNDYKKPPLGPPPKPARSLEKRREVSGDRIHDSSGTEGESSQQSQRSVVYLHATTIGEIPQPYVLNARRKTVSRDDLSSRPTKLQPMTRTVSRSVSVLAPWKPKHLRDGHEINYSQTNDKLKNHQSVRSEINKKVSTLTKPKKETITLSRSKKAYSKDELSSEKSSSLKSSQVSKQDYPSQLRTNHKKESISRNDTITRKNNKENNLSTLESSGRRWNH